MVLQWCQYLSMGGFFVCFVQDLDAVSNGAEA
jgi:hypothetical protein